MLFNHALNSSPVCPMACHSTSRQAFECNLDSRSMPDGELAFFHGLRRSIHIEHSNNYVGSEGRTIDYSPGRTRIIPWPACSTAWLWNDGRSSVGLGYRLKVRAQRQTHSTLQLSLSVQIVGYPKEETDRLRQRLSPPMLKVLCSSIFQAIRPLTRRRRATTNRFVRWHLSCCYRVQSLVEEPSTEQAFVYQVADSISP